MREELANRPLLLACAGLIVGLTASGWPYNLLFLGLIGLAVRAPKPLVAAGVGFALGVALAWSPISDSRVSGQFVVDSVPTPGRYGGASFIAEGRTGRFLVRERVGMPDLGDEVKLSGVAEAFPPDQAGFARSRGLSGSVQLESAPVAVHSGGVLAWGSAWRRSLISFSDKNLPSRQAALMDALAVHGRTDFDAQTKQDLQQSGAIQIVTAAGLHLLVLASILEALLDFLPLPLFVRKSICFLVILIFAAGGGFHPGAVRALFTTGLRGLAPFLGREYDALSGLSVFGCVYLLLRPYAVLDSGFQLTMVLGVGLALIGWATVGWSRRWSWPARGLGAWAIATPIGAQLFNVVSFAAIPVNLLTVGILPLCLLGLLFAHGMSFISPALGSEMLAPVSMGLEGLDRAVNFFGRSAGWGFRVADFSGYLVAIMYAVVLILWRPQERPSG